MLFQAEPLYKLFTKMTHSAKRIATIHTQDHHTSHKTYHKSHKTYHKSHKTYHTSHKSHMIHDMQTSLDAFSSLPTLEAVYENDP